MAKVSKNMYLGEVIEIIGQVPTSTLKGWGLIPHLPSKFLGHKKARKPFVKNKVFERAQKSQLI